MGLDLRKAGFIDRQHPPPPATHGLDDGGDDIAASVGAMTIVSMKRGSNVSGATSIFVADRYLCRSMERCIRAYVINEVISKAKANGSTNPEQPFFSKNKELPWVGFEPTTLRFLGMSALQAELPGQLSR